ncbi:MAG: hypothetical protein PHP42_12000 [Bacteroidota bacterium]|nr:hypothetical protein [Bacteroidota bacterium]
MPKVILPRERLICMDEKTITIDLPERAPKKKKKIDYSVIERSRGLLKGRVKEDPVKYQRRIRAEWERKLP